MGEHEQRPSTLACAFGEQRILRACELELDDAVSVHTGADVLHDFERHACRLRSEMHDVLHAAGTCDGARGHLGCDPDEHVAWEERLKSAPRAHERKERELMLPPEIALDQPLR